MPSQTQPFTYLAFAWLDPPILFGDNAFLSDLFRHLGGKAPTLKKIGSPYPQVSDEWLITKKVSYLFYLADSGEQPSQQDAEKFAAKWWPRETPKVIRLPSDYFSTPTFTPMKHWTDLYPLAKLKLPESCEKL